jgi:hypothetical protein
MSVVVPRQSDLATLIRKAHKDGVPTSDIAKWTDLSLGAWTNSNVPALRCFA